MEVIIELDISCNQHMHILSWGKKIAELPKVLPVQSQSYPLSDATQSQ